MSETFYDVIGIGLSNRALAIDLEKPDSKLPFRFLDLKKQPNWQDGMLLRDSDVQNNPLKGLVTPQNPRSHYARVNYLNRPLTYPLQRECAEYIKSAEEKPAKVSALHQPLQAFIWPSRSNHLWSRHHNREVPCLQQP